MKIAVRYYRLEVREPFAQGNIILSEPALVLNRLRASAIREIWTKRVPPNRILDPSEVLRLREEFAHFDQEYFLPAPINLKFPYTLEEEIEELKAEGYSGSDSELLARRRFAARLGIREPKLEDLI